ncbi:MAG: protein kinase [Verrucomicrobia bacterium]|nr:protein kinase [Verrucomicrobiota bacterium]
MPDEPQNCPRCGTRLHRSAGDYFCPKCRFEQVLAVSPAAGERVHYFGDYELLEEIGHGGMGRVYRARQISLGRIVAIKFLRGGKLAGSDALKRFGEEARTVAGLPHTGIVAVHEVGEHEGQPYFTMDFIEGQNLAELTREKPLAPPIAAQYLKIIAEAIHHVHQRGILHRDLKPSNVLIDEFDQPRVTDFGVAKRLEGDSDLTQSGQMLGTPNYMPPEQAQAKRGSVTVVSDVYSLGAILYHLLTSRPPFAADNQAALIFQVINTEPVSPRLLNLSVPLDLETICLKCLEKEPRKRYGSAQELADELGRFLRHEPIQARPVGSFEKVWRWCRRNPAVAALGAATVLLFLVVLIGSPTSIYKINKGLKQAQQNAKEGRKIQLLEQVTRILLTPRSDSWHREAWSRLREAQALIPDNQVRDQAAATLIGTMVSSITNFDGFGALPAHFDSSGENILMPSQTNGTRLWNLRGNSAVDFTNVAAWPAGFLNGKTPVQFVPQASKSNVIDVIDLQRREAIRHLGLPASLASVSVSNEWTRLLVFTPNCAQVALSAVMRDGTSKVFVWDTASERLLQQWPLRADFLALTPDGSFLATGTANEVAVWSIASGERVSQWKNYSGRVRSLAFCRDLQEMNRPHTDLQAWLLAVGDEGGTVTLSSSKEPRIFFRGSNYEVDALAFSPDETLLISGGRSELRVWDILTGERLLAIDDVDYCNGISFSPDGKTLLASAATPLATGVWSNERVKLWHFRNGHGVQTLRGLSAQVSKVCLSSDSRRIAALSHDWRIGIWDLQSGQLQRILTPPLGDFADNAAIAFNSDATQLAFSGDARAVVWDLTNGSEIFSTNLPVGLVDLLAYHPSGVFISGRMETKGDRAPYSDAPYRQFPRVFRIRALSGSHAPRLIKEIDEFNFTLIAGRASPNGKTFVLDGKSARNGRGIRRLAAFDTLSGERVWEKVSFNPHDSSVLPCASDSSFVGAKLDSSGVTHATMVDVESGKTYETLPGFVVAIGPQNKTWLARKSPAEPGSDYVQLLAEGNKPLVSLGIHSRLTDLAWQFNANGNLVAVGTVDGPVLVFDVNEIKTRLDTLGLGWPKTPAN